jgi:hypothetical protein
MMRPRLLTDSWKLLIKLETMMSLRNSMMSTIGYFILSRNTPRKVKARGKRRSHMSNQVPIILRKGLRVRAKSNLRNNLG